MTFSPILIAIIAYLLIFFGGVIVGHNNLTNRPGWILAGSVLSFAGGWLMGGLIGELA